MNRFIEESIELIDSYKINDLENMKNECKDGVNFLWFIYENCKETLNDEER